MKKATFFTFVLSLVILSCDKIDDPIPDDLGDSITGGGNGLDSLTEYIADPSLNLTTAEQLADLINNNEWDSIKAPDNSSQRFLVLEEFTGHECINCPIGTKEVVRLDGIFGDQLIPIAIHAGQFAIPREEGNKFTTDLRPDGEHGETYAITFNPGDAYPRGMVNRINGIVSRVNEWEADINSMKDVSPVAQIDLTNFYDSTNNILRIDVSVEWLQTLTDGPYSLQVMVKEDHIVDWQKDLNEEVQDYEHRYVLRKVVNDTWGKALSPTTSGTLQKVQYIVPIDPSWKKKDIESVAFIFDNDGSSYEVLQANAAPISQ